MILIIAAIAATWIAVLVFCLALRAAAGKPVPKREERP